MKRLLTQTLFNNLIEEVKNADSYMRSNRPTIPFLIITEELDKKIMYAGGAELKWEIYGPIIYSTIDPDQVTIYFKALPAIILPTTLQNRYQCMKIMIPSVSKKNSQTTVETIIEIEWITTSLWDDLERQL